VSSCWLFFETISEIRRRVSSQHFWELSPLSVHHILVSTTRTCFIHSSYCTALPEVLYFVLPFSYLHLLFRLLKHDGLAFFCYALQYNNIAPSNAVIQRNKDEANQPVQTGQIHSSLCYCALVNRLYDTLLFGYVWGCTFNTEFSFVGGAESFTNGRLLSCH